MKKAIIVGATSGIGNELAKMNCLKQTERKKLEHQFEKELNKHH